MTMATTIGWKVGGAQPHSGAAAAITIINYGQVMVSSGAINCQYILLSLLVLLLSVGVCCGVFCVSLACCGCLLFVFGV